ncbi:hypothetical protein G8J22_02370 [Lentilactobacillus hilgardii]|uniref:hypothetical protein n=1 Tax=Lentilactobacillus hilgardii TaxID=1588 RepID=UPI00019C5D0F|nr:hypothetical protein [Lentilactobacillus hilgardii]EEI19562.1 hypothetical protein HMPREF0497_1633 [Lentilactobacillus buchneri ATCC 11577]QIR10362.1 hypothetical protein G8J22_02370 [Lentilactobacillus hilgardii]
MTVSTQQLQLTVFQLLSGGLVTFSPQLKLINDATASNDAFGNHKMAIQHDQSGTMTFTLDPNTAAYKQILDMAGTYQ